MRDPLGAEDPTLPIRIGISACLLGENVRYDGGHKRDAFLVETFGKFVEWVPICPEVELGLGTPRPPIRLVRAEGDVRLIAPDSGTDHTAAMQAFADKRAAVLKRANLCGYVLKKDSPSCGMERVKVYRPQGGVPTRDGRGLFARALLAHLPHLPVEEEGRLCDPKLRESFVERVFAYRRLESLFARKWTIADVIAFHTAHKLQLLAHRPQTYEELGRLVAQARRARREELESRYREEFMRALAVPAPRSRHVNVLQHMAGYFKKQVDDDSRRELAAVIGDYRNGLVPLIVPLTLIRHYVRHFAISYLANQYYLDPHPKELMLRNQV
jgi:uncharacterized protein YbgA (DUF1722 family)/uncharacterized protein YbbK (DUF523 family)